MQNLPCPFCGGLEQETYNLYCDDLHRLVYCKCGAQAGEAEDEEGAIAVWNSPTPKESQETPMEPVPCPFCGGQELEDVIARKVFLGLVQVRRTRKPCGK